MNQDFKANCKNQIWFGDITYIPTQEGMIYCSVFIIDCFTKKDCRIQYSLTHERNNGYRKLRNGNYQRETQSRTHIFIATMAHNIQGIDFMK